MEWFKGHHRAILVVALLLALPVNGILSLQLIGTVGLYVMLATYLLLAVVTGWVLRMKGRSLHWLWPFLLWNWYGYLVPVVVALRSKQSVVTPPAAIDCAGARTSHTSAG